MAISNTQLSNAGPVDIFLCPGSSPNDVQEHAVTCMIFCNTSNSLSDPPITLNVYAVPRGAGVGPETQIIKNLDIPTGETLTFDSEKLILSSEDRIYATSSTTTGLTATISSMRVS
jgi:hypothetical protein